MFGKLAPGLLDLTENLGLGDQLALQPAGESQQEGVSVRPLEVLEGNVARKLFTCQIQLIAADEDRHPTLAGIDQEQLLRRRGLGRRRKTCVRTTPLQDIEQSQLHGLAG